MRNSKIKPDISVPTMLAYGSNAIITFSWPGLILTDRKKLLSASPRVKRGGGGTEIILI